MEFFSVLRHLAEKQADQAMTQKVNNFKGKAFAASDNTEVFGEMLEINGFKFLNIKLVGPLKVKTFKGCTVVFHAPAKQIELESDTMEIDTDYSRKISLGITGFDIDLEEELETLIREKSITHFDVTIDKKTYVYTVNNPGVLAEIMDQPVSDDDEIEYTEIEVEHEEDKNSEEKPFGGQPSSDPFNPQG